jgi:hypothetical protein
MLSRADNWDLDENDATPEQPSDIGWYIAAMPDEVAERLAKICNDASGLGTPLMITGEAWADRERRLRSMRRFMARVAPQRCLLEPTGDKAEAA